MKLLFIADIHIKLGQKNIPTAWAKSRFDALWAKVSSICDDETIDMIIVGGDVFDRVPTMEELEIFYNMLTSFQELPNIIYPGNHEATGKYSTFLTHLKAAVRPFNTIIIDEFTTNVIDNCDILPYNDLKKVDWHSYKGNDILFTHVRGDIPPHVKAEVDLTLFDKWNLVFAGDLHARSNSQRNIIYPGSPITTTFHRAESKGENGVYIIDTNSVSYNFIDLELPQLIRATVSSKEAMVPTPYHHTIYELIGDIVDLKQIENSELLDKKITKRNTQATLDLKNMTIEEELFEYLVEVAGVADPQAIIQEYYDSIKTTSVG